LSHPPVISIIDDNGSIRSATYNLVRSLEYVAYTFESAEQFLRSSHLDQTSCVIADVQMPKMSGIELQAHLRSLGNRVPFIFITAFSVESARERALRAGAICFLTKPFDGATLVECVETALKGHDERTDK
jgi:FixJ family two-component response regulator